MNWKPISEMPDPGSFWDGKTFVALAYSLNGDSYDSGRIKVFTQMGAWNSRDGHFSGRAPTHFLALPEPPKEERK